MHGRLIQSSKLSKGVIVNADGCLSIGAPAVGWQPYLDRYSDNLLNCDKRSLGLMPVIFFILCEDTDIIAAH